jgi:hypothetical protein
MNPAVILLIIAVVVFVGYLLRRGNQPFSSSTPSEPPASGSPGTGPKNPKVD